MTARLESADFTRRRLSCVAARGPAASRFEVSQSPEPPPSRCLVCIFETSSDEARITAIQETASLAAGPDRSRLAWGGLPSRHRLKGLRLRQALSNLLKSFRQPLVFPNAHVRKNRTAPAVQPCAVDHDFLVSVPERRDRQAAPPACQAAGADAGSLRLELEDGNMR